ncbi:MAG: carbohydrate ABC transporter permease [Thermomicrobiales bacterium]
MALPTTDAVTRPGSAQTAGSMLAASEPRYWRNRKPRKQAPWMEDPHPLLQIGKGVILAFIVIVMLFPFVHVVAVSFSSYQDVLTGGLILFPTNPTLDAYRVVFDDGSVIQALKVSAGLTILGTAAQMIATTAMAYGLSRPSVPGSRFALLIVLGAMLFYPGMIPSFLLIKELGLLDEYPALILPGLIGAFNMIILRQFFMNLPQELLDSAKIDGASDFRVLFSIVLPLSKAVLAVISLFYAVGIWNSFFNAILYMNTPSKWPVQVILQQIVLEGTALNQASLLNPNQPPPPPATIEMAVVVIATVPILIVYPFLQKYFTRGVLTGAIKG